MKKSTKAVIKEIIFDTSVTFAVLTLVIINLATRLGNLNAVYYMTSDIANRFGIFSLIFGISGILRSIRALPGAISVILRYIISVTAFGIIIMTSVVKSQNQIFLGIILFTVIYFIVFGTVKLLSGIGKKTAEIEN